MALLRNNHRFSGCLCSEIHKQLSQPTICFVNDANQEDQIIDHEDIIYWSSEWISIGRVLGDYYACITYGLHNDVEIGIRRAPGTLKREFNCVYNSNYPVSSNIWWYCKKDIAKDLAEQNMSVENFIVKLTDGLSEVLNLMDCNPQRNVAK